MTKFRASETQSVNRELEKMKFFNWIFSIIAVVVGLAAYVPAVEAHGERNQEPFLRMRTLHWYDVKWSATKLKVNEEMTMTGKFRIFDDWASQVKKPDTVYLGVGSPGPAVVRIESYMGGAAAIQSSSAEIGRDYDFKIVLRGRLPGRHHIHPMLNVQDGGPLVGPGEFVDVTGRLEDFVLPVTTMTGEKIPNLETWGVANVVTWHAIWLVIAIVWLLWWVRRPLLVPRYLALQAGEEDILVTPLDRKVGAGILVITLALIFGGFFMAESKYPRTVPLQGGRAKMEPLPLAEKVVYIKVTRATYDVPGRSMKMQFNLTNNTEKPLQIGEFTAASLRFINHEVPAAVAGVDANYPKELLPKTGLKVDNNEPIQPGATKAIFMEATDVAWETERLTSLLNDPDNRFGALLFLSDSEGKRHLATMGGPILPILKKHDSRATRQIQ